MTEKNCQKRFFNNNNDKMGITILTLSRLSAKKVFNAYFERTNRSAWSLFHRPLDKLTETLTNSKEKMMTLGVDTRYSHGTFFIFLITIHTNELETPKN